MTGFENYTQELRNIDHEIAHWAMVCGFDADDNAALQACRAAPMNAGKGPSEETLRGLLLLRMALEAEMAGLGMTPPPYRPAGKVQEDR